MMCGLSRADIYCSFEILNKKTGKINLGLSAPKVRPQNFNKETKEAVLFRGCISYPAHNARTRRKTYLVTGPVLAPHFHFSLSCTGEGNGNPLQCSCLENPRDGTAWWAAVYGVPQSRTRLTQLSSSCSTHKYYRAEKINVQNDIHHWLNIIRKC